MIKRRVMDEARLREAALQVNRLKAELDAAVAKELAASRAIGGHPADSDRQIAYQVRRKQAELVRRQYQRAVRSLAALRGYYR